MICNHIWKAPRHMVNTSGERFETLPVNHVCAKINDHNNATHECMCGEEENVKTGDIDGEPYSIPDGCIVLRQETYRNLTGLAQLISDLDRNFEGRHQGDGSYGEESGLSQGNPTLPIGMHIGFTISGNHIVVPLREFRYDPKAWIQPKQHNLNLEET